MRAVRVLLAVVGVSLLAFGANRLYETIPPKDLLDAAIWAAAILIAHDGIFAPVCLLLGHGAKRILPVAWWQPVLIGTIFAVTVCALAAPVVLPRPPDKRALNPTVLDQPYTASALSLLAVIVLATVIAGIARTRGSAASAPDPASDRT
ncbi:hypothetical protein [Tsukamurella paurometabola]|uniref:Uncharacterized protein n=1 Tax=Tsukamurella paurometabola TaxID=2061 RepID=A0A3P8K288_TSUPA|nr:hypothetical protein [Tsukamurella paurometabola]UEA82108.1 hypothetical protein LK411_17255 [Tsukamurella paurometabola]VDR39144.1 Uncharacterised protein [Tsukamurella paurometabola]